MRWSLEFYNEQRGVLARYGVEAPSPVAAVEQGRQALRADHPPGPARATGGTLVERAARVGGEDGSGWVLYRIGPERQEPS